MDDYGNAVYARGGIVEPRVVFEREPDGCVIPLRMIAEHGPEVFVRLRNPLGTPEQIARAVVEALRRDDDDEA